MSELIESWDQERNFIDSGAEVKYHHKASLILKLVPGKRSSERLAMALQRQGGCLDANILFATL